jgi:hypothetical protein
MAIPTMALLAPSYWQVAAGAEGRDYSEWFFQHGIAFVGGEDQIATIQQVKHGDRIALKRGTSQLLAVGIVRERNGAVAGKEDKQWLEDFDGWELPGYCYVDWHKLPEPLDCKGFIQGTISGINNEQIRKTIDEQLLTTPPAGVCLPEPEATAPIADEQVLSFLIEHGLRPGAAEEFTHALKRIRLLVNYYVERLYPSDVREHEARTFLIVPLLIALGWAEHQLKIELGVSGGRVDIAGFRRPFVRNTDGTCNLHDCTLIVESKGFSQGLTYAAGQGQTYAKQFPNCKVVLVSNGYCYKAFCRSGDGFSTKPAAYLNLRSPTERFPLDPANVKGALEVFRLLLPSNSFD